jgi:hypothetical protein
LKTFRCSLQVQVPPADPEDFLGTQSSVNNQRSDITKGLAGGQQISALLLVRYNPFASNLPV